MNKNRYNFNQRDQEAVDAVLGKYSLASRFPIDFGLLVQRWTSFVRNVELGYTRSIYEYLNDLSSRSILAKVEEELSPDGQQEFQSIIAPLDVRFKEVTKIISKQVTASANDTQWWKFRLPLELKPLLKKGFEEQGVL